MVGCGGLIASDACSAIQHIIPIDLQLGSTQLRVPDMSLQEAR